MYLSIKQIVGEKNINIIGWNGIASLREAFPWVGLLRFALCSPEWGASKWKKPICRAADKAKKKRPLLSKLKRSSFFCFALTGWAFSPLAVRGGFEPPEPLRVRQFSKLLVSATHPPHQNPAGLAAGSAKIQILLNLQIF